MNWNSSFSVVETKGYRSKHIIERPLSEGIRKEQAKLQKEAERQRRADEKQLAKERNTERLRALIERLKENERIRLSEAGKGERGEKAKEGRERYSKQKDKPSLSEEEKKHRAKSLKNARNKSYYERHKEIINAKRSVKSKTRKTTEGYGHISPNCWERLRDLE